MRPSSRGSPFRGRGSLRGGRAKGTSSASRGASSPHTSGDEGTRPNKRVSFATGNAQNATSTAATLGGAASSSSNNGNNNAGFGSTFGSNSIVKTNDGSTAIGKTNRSGGVEAPRPPGTRKGLQAMIKSQISQNSSPKDNSSAQSAFGSKVHYLTQKKASFQDRYASLKKSREIERAKAIRDGFLADPERPRNLADAITPVGTCQDMCAEFERLERVVQNDVWGPEMNQTSGPGSKQQPDEARMVKKFRRAAAGIDEQLPSDLRPPHILQKTLDYLFNVLITTSESLPLVHHFVWDRTRAVRNDFSIQQVTKPHDLKIAIECYERIARFHILSLHQLALEQKPYDKYDAQQEREQLDKTLLSLIQYYDDSREKVQSPHEAEFRAYCIIFQIQDPVPDLEDRMQTWPQHILKDARVQKALELYSSANNTDDGQGPLKPRAAHPIAQTNWAKFMRLLGSNQISYLMACVAEIYLPMMRRRALSALWNSYRPSGGKRKIDDWTLDELRTVFGFESEDMVQSFVEAFGFEVSEREDGVAFLDLDSVSGRGLLEGVKGSQVQRKSAIVEKKRHHRALSAVIQGLNVKKAMEAGLMDDQRYLENAQADDDSMTYDEGVPEPPGEGELFVEQSSDEEEKEIARQEALLKEAKARRAAKQQLAQKRSQVDPASHAKEREDRSSAQPVSSQGLSTETQPKPFPFTTDIPQIKPAQPTFSAPQSMAPSTTPLFSWSSNTGINSSPTSQPSTSTLFATSASKEGKSSTQTQITRAPAAPPAPVFKFEPPSSDQHSSTTKPFNFDNKPQSSSFSPFNFNSIQQPKSPSQSQNVGSILFSTPSSSQNTPPTFNWPSSDLSKAHADASKPAFAGFLAPKPPTINENPVQLIGEQTSLQPSNPNDVSKLSQNKTTPLKPRESAQTLFSDQSSARPKPMFDSKSPAIPQSKLTTSGVERSEAEQKRMETQSLAAKRKRASETLELLARELLLGPNGFLHQYAEYFVPSAIKNVCEAVEDQVARKRADDFRLSRIMQRYAIRWKNIWWKNRLAAHGRARRQRLAQEKENRKRSRENSISATIEGFRETMSRSLTVSPPQKSSTGQTVSHGKEANPVATAVSFGNSVVSIPDASPTTDERTIQDPRVGHRRSQSTPNQSSGINSQSSARSIRQNRSYRSSRLQNSFLPGETIGREEPSQNSVLPADTTRSTYFKLKAMGVDPGSLVSPAQRKRPRSSGSDVTLGISQAKRPLTDVISSATANNLASTKSPTPMNKEDDDIFSSVRQIREAMSESVAFFQEEVAKDDEFRKSLGSSKGSPPMRPVSLQERSQSPILKGSAHSKGRTAIDWKQLAADRAAAARAVAPSPAKHAKELPPAYRNRVSKFLPREKYADVLMARRKDTGAREKYVPRRFRYGSTPQQDSLRKEQEIEVVNAEIVGGQSPHRDSMSQTRAQSSAPDQESENQANVIDPSFLVDATASQHDETTLHPSLHSKLTEQASLYSQPNSIAQPGSLHSTEASHAATPYTESMFTPDTSFNGMQGASVNDAASNRAVRSPWYTGFAPGLFISNDNMVDQEQTSSDHGDVTIVQDEPLTNGAGISLPMTIDYPSLDNFSGAVTDPFGSIPHRSDPGLPEDESTEKVTETIYDNFGPVHPTIESGVENYTIHEHQSQQVTHASTHNSREVSHNRESSYHTSHHASQEPDFLLNAAQSALGTVHTSSPEMDRDHIDVNKDREEIPQGLYDATRHNLLHSQLDEVPGSPIEVSSGSPRVSGHHRTARSQQDSSLQHQPEEMQRSKRNERRAKKQRDASANRFDLLAALGSGNDEDESDAEVALSEALEDQDGLEEDSLSRGTNGNVNNSRKESHPQHGTAINGFNNGSVHNRLSPHPNRDAIPHIEVNNRSRSQISRESSGSGKWAVSNTGSGVDTDEEVENDSIAGLDDEDGKEQSASDGEGQGQGQGQGQGDGTEEEEEIESEPIGFHVREHRPSSSPPSSASISSRSRSEDDEIEEDGVDREMRSYVSADDDDADADVDTDVDRPAHADSEDEGGRGNEEADDDVDLDSREDENEEEDEDEEVNSQEEDSQEEDSQEEEDEEEIQAKLINGRGGTSVEDAIEL